METNWKRPTSRKVWVNHMLYGACRGTIRRFNQEGARLKIVDLDNGHTCERPAEEIYETKTDAVDACEDLSVGLHGDGRGLL